MTNQCIFNVINYTLKEQQKVKKDIFKIICSPAKYLNWQSACNGFYNLYSSTSLVGRKPVKIVTKNITNYCRRKKKIVNYLCTGQNISFT